MEILLKITLTKVEEFYEDFKKNNEIKIPKNKYLAKFSKLE